MSISLTHNHEDSPNIETENIRDLPKYCDYFKFFLVEELALENNFSVLHYGKCTIIGKLREDVEGDFYLENIKLPNLPSEYNLPEGSVELRVLRFNYFGTKLQQGRFCELCGEVVLLNTKEPSENKIPHTSRWVCEQLLAFGEDKLSKEAFVKNLLETYKPAIKLWLINDVERGGELAERNLQIRMLSQR